MKHYPCSGFNAIYFFEGLSDVHLRSYGEKGAIVFHEVILWSCLEYVQRNEI